MPLPALDGWPRFQISPDGNTIFYVRPSAPPAEAPLWGLASWTPDGRRVAICDVEVDLGVWVMENFLPKSEAAGGGRSR